METNIEGVYAVGDMRVKRLRQVVSAADGAVAAWEAEKYIEELNDFNEVIVKSDKPIILQFFNPMSNDCLNFGTLLEQVVTEGGSQYKIVKVNMLAKKTLAKKYGIKELKRAVVVLKQGEVVNQLDCKIDMENLESQLI